MPGVLLKRVYQEGSQVKQGQTLFLIDPAPLRASLNASEAQLASARATYANAKVAADRARSLAPQQFVSKSDLDNAESAERTALAAVKQAEAAVTSSRINLGYAEVTAPISGVANKQQVTEGALVGQGDVTLLTTVDQLDPLYVNFSLSVDELTQLRAQQAKGALALSGDSKATVNVKLADGTTYGEPGTLDFSSTTVDPATGAVSLRALLPNPQQILLPGAFVSFQANLGERNNAFLVPQQALLRDTTGGYVMVVGADGKVVRKNVKTDGAQGGNWLVSDGLAAGDKVIVAGVQKVRKVHRRWPSRGPRARTPTASRPQATPQRRALHRLQARHRPTRPSPSRPMRPSRPPPIRTSSNGNLPSCLNFHRTSSLRLGGCDPDLAQRRDRDPQPGRESYPNIAPPQVTVSATYPGASADTTEKSVTQVIEQQLTGIDHLLYFSSRPPPTAVRRSP